MIEIRLSNQSWYYDPSNQLGPAGGFGTVFLGEDEYKKRVAVKKLKVDAKQAGHRELRIADEFAGRNFKNIIPIYDSGQDSESDSYFIVMALAKKSLQDDLRDQLQFSDLESVNILLSVVQGLQEVPEIVHRDLKPGNILFHENKWKIADFGIARFIEESTSARTLKGWLSDSYAAPEQWKLEHTSSQTDIYAIGCIGYELLTGSPPFTGSSREDVRKQHLEVQPPTITNHNNLLYSLLTMMLRKNPHARPSHERVREQLEKIAKDSNQPSVISSLSELQTIGQEDAEVKAKKEAETQSREAARKKRQELADEAYQILNDIIEKLFRTISENTPTATGGIGSPTTHFARQFHSINLGNARLSVDYLIEAGLASENKFTKSGWDVVAGAVISVFQEKPENRWGASLWYMRRHPSNDYRWHEVPYMSNLFTRNPPKYAPFELRNIIDADEAAAPGMAAYQHAHTPEHIDDENESDFINNWLKRFIQAYRGQLQRPSRLPYD